MLLNSNPVEEHGAAKDVRVLDKVAASVRARAGKCACDWKFRGIIGEASQQRFTQEHQQQQRFTQEHQQQQLIGPMSLAGASAVGEQLADERRGTDRRFAANVMAAMVSANAQYDLIPREVGAVSCCIFSFTKQIRFEPCAA